MKNTNNLSIACLLDVLSVIFSYIKK